MKRSEFLMSLDPGRTGRVDQGVLPTEVLRLAGQAIQEALARAGREDAEIWDPEEPELPRDLELERSGHGAMIVRRGHSCLVDLTRVDRQYPMEEAEIKHLEVLVGAANRLPALEALARDLAMMSDADIRCLGEVFRLRASALGLLPEEKLQCAKT